MRRRGQPGGFPSRQLSAHPSPPPPPPLANPILIPFWTRHLPRITPAPQKLLGARMWRPHVGCGGGVCAGPLTAPREGRGEKMGPPGPPRCLATCGVAMDVAGRGGRKDVRACGPPWRGGRPAVCAWRRRGGATTPTAAAATATAAAAAEAAAAAVAAASAGGPPPISGWARVVHQRRRPQTPRRAAATSGRGAGAKLDGNPDTKSVRGPSAIQLTV